MTDTATVYRLTLPLPPLLNRLYRHGQGRVYKDPAADAYAWDVLAAAREAGLMQPLVGPVALDIAVTFEREADIDSVCKVLLDAGEGSLYIDDRQVVALRITKRVRRGAGGLVVEVRAL